MRRRKRTTPPHSDDARQGWKSKLQTVQVRFQNDNSFQANSQYAVRLLATRYRLSLASATVIAGLVGIGSRA